MKKTLLFLFSLVICTLCQAQNVVTGTLHADNNLPIEYANVVLLAQADSTLLTGTTSDVNGRFSLTIPAPNNTPCLIRITSIGYQTICQPIQAGNAGVFRMENRSQMLDEVVVETDFPVTRLEGDAMITNVEGTMLAKTGTAQEMLDYIPGVASQRGTLEVLGRGTPAVYINSRLMRSSTELEQLSAEDIQSVEVVNNPGARYDATAKAVIRIRTKKAAGDGFGFSTRSYAYYNKRWDVMQQANLNYRKGGLDIFGMIFLYDGNFWEKFTLRQDAYLKDNSHWTQVLRGGGNSEEKNIIADFGMNYVFNENHSVGFKYRYDRYPGNHIGDTYDTDVSKDGVAFENTYSLSSLDLQSTDHSLNVYYNGNVGAWNIDLNTDLLWVSDKKSQYVDETVTPESRLSSQPITTFNKVNNKLYASKLIFSRPLFGGEFSLGGEYSYTNRRSNYLNIEGILDDDFSEIKESNAAAFTEYSREIGNFQFLAGLRYEHVEFDYYKDNIHQDEQSRKYDDLFPSLSVLTAFGEVQMQLGYMQEISRPSYNSLRSHIYYANHYTYETGNPFLQPAISHDISLIGVYKFWQLNASYQRRKDDVMSTTVPYSEENPIVVLFKPVNTPSYDVAYVQLSAMPTIKRWSPRFTLSVKKQWFEAESTEGPISLNRPQFQFRWQNTFELPAGFLFNLNGNWQSKYDTMNARHNKASWRVDADIQKSLLNDRLTLQLKGHDLFLSQRSSWVDYRGDIYATQRVAKPNTRGISFVVRYRFNQGADKYKGTGAGESQKGRM